MAQIAGIKAAQDSLRETFNKKILELQSQLQSGGSSKETVARVAEELRTFKELMFSMLNLIEKQIDECIQSIDVIETRHRRKALMFLGVPEVEKEDCRLTISSIVSKINIEVTPGASISSCHRMGVSSTKHHRPILVWFSTMELRSAVWRNKSKLKGTSVTVKEFLTRSRQLIFAKARQHFDMRACWTQDGVIIVKAADGSRHKVATAEELNSLMEKYPRASGSSTASKGGAGVGSAGTSSGSNKPRKQ